MSEGMLRIGTNHAHCSICEPLSHPEVSCEHDLGSFHQKKLWLKPFSIILTLLCCSWTGVHCRDNKHRPITCTEATVIDLIHQLTHYVIECYTFCEQQICIKTIIGLQHMVTGSI